MKWKRAIVGGVLAEILAIPPLIPVGVIFGNPSAQLNVAVLIVSFLAPLVMTQWVVKRIDTKVVLHGALVGFSAFMLYVVLGVGGTLIASALGVTAEFNQPLIYWIAHAMKVLGGSVGGAIAARRKTQVTSSAPAR